MAFSEEELQKIERWCAGLVGLVGLTGPIREKATLNKLPDLVTGYRQAKKLLELKFCNMCCWPTELCDTCKLIDAFLNPQPTKKGETNGRPSGD